MTNLSKLCEKLIKDIPELIPVHFGLSPQLARLVIAVRLEKGVTQDELARVLNVETNVIHKIEGGSKDVTIALYEKTLEALGMTYEEMNDLINIDQVEDTPFDENFNCRRCGDTIIPGKDYCEDCLEHKVKQSMVEVMDKYKEVFEGLKDR